MTGARPGQVPGPRTSALVQEKLVPVLASPKIQFMSAFPFLEILGPLEIGDIVWNTLKDTCIWLERVVNILAQQRCSHILERELTISLGGRSLS